MSDQRTADTEREEDEPASPDQQTWAPWGGADHADPVLLAGRPSTIYIYAVALLLAVIADFTAFYQVLELVMADLYEVLVFLMVAGFTGVVLALAHFAGQLFRDRRAGDASASSLVTHACLILAWLALGALAFWVRYNTDAHADAGASSGLSVSGTPSPSPAGSGGQSTLQGAAIFAGLYLGTGLVAMVGGYLTHNPLRDGFVRALRHHRAATETHAIASRRHEIAAAISEFRTAEIEAAERVVEESIRAHLALAEELKQVARLEITRRLQDVSATDNVFTDDARPYTYRPFPN
ncbi:hypothetical protein [Actinomadura latina]|uniref:Uncharacterized protein n=1 Tax=Actinomadura latina TaxID=163603 RepID=A0A846YWG5_9ACTN|nr:hypothetical protein [Actinomadura latina]NKZ05270.1 hypothetical protein [Actinomadura latina]